jgi:hypothetical protein
MKSTYEFRFYSDRDDVAFNATGTVRPQATSTGNDDFTEQSPPLSKTWPEDLAGLQHRRPPTKTRRYIRFLILTLTLSLANTLDIAVATRYPL